MGSGTPTGTGGGRGGSGTAATLSPSNFLAASYINVYSTGLYTDSTLSSGGTSAGNPNSSSSSSTSSSTVPKPAASFFKTTTFGQPLYTIQTNTARGGTATVRSGTAGGGLGGTATTTTGPNSFGSAISGTRYPHIGTTMKFTTKPIGADQFRGDLADLIQRSSTIKAKDAVRIEVDGGFVRLRGTVTDDDERRLVVNLISMAEHVRGVVNELEVK